MHRATRMAGRGDWPVADAVGTVVLDYEARHRRRIRLVCDNETPVLLDLEKATALRDGDGLALEGGGWVAVQAAAEDLVEVTCGSAHDLHRIAWHLGNRHCPAAIEAESVS